MCSRRALHRQGAFAPPALLLVALLGLARAGDARTLLSAEEAVALAFPGATAKRESVFLTEAQRRDAERRAGGPAPSALLARYVVRRAGAVVGWAYLDTHVVRTLPETVLVALDAGGRALRVEVLSFAEPEEYRPREAWYRQFAGRELSSELSLTGAIRPVTGATLTARATTAATRWVLAVHAVLEGGGQ